MSVYNGLSAQSGEGIIMGRRDGEKDTGLVFEAEIRLKTELPHVIPVQPFEISTNQLLMIRKFRLREVK